MTTLTPLHEPYCRLVRAPVTRSDFLEGLARLATEGLVEVTDLVHDIHREIVLTPIERVLPQAADIWRYTLTNRVYQIVRSIMQFSGNNIAQGLRMLNAHLGTQKREAQLPANLKLIANIINGVMGDHLIYQNNPLALSMLLYDRYGNVYDGRKLKGRVLIMVHGLCMSYLSWHPGQNISIAEHVLYTQPDTTILHLDYNTGRRISQNGRSFSRLLEELVEDNPEITHIDFVGHSMGGLVSRSAMFYGKQDGLNWLHKADNLVCLGSPHHGAVLERIGFFIQEQVSKLPIAGSLSHLLDVRSAGILDLRHGSVRDDDWEYLLNRSGMNHDLRRPAPLPSSVNCFLLAGDLDEAPNRHSRDIIGDGLVSVASALGEHKGDHHLNVPESHKAICYGVNHVNIQYHPRVRRQVVAWLNLSVEQKRRKGQRVILLPESDILKKAS